MRKIYLLITCIILFQISNSQTIIGKVSDASNQESLIGVNIILENGQGTSTNIDGEYKINVEPGLQKIKFKYLGYETIEKNISIKLKNDTIINIKLRPSSKQLSTVVISAGRFEQKIEEITVSMEVIKPSLIENKNTTNIKDAIEQVPGLNVTDGQANIRGGSGWSYGAGTRVLVLVDDMPLISGDAGQAQWSLIATENINQVEIIKGASSALYGSSALNGVINIRTSFPSQKDINKNKLPGFTKVNTHFGLIDIPKRKELAWSGIPSNQAGSLVFKRRAFRGIDFLHSMKIKNLDLSLGGNIFMDDGYRMGETTDRKRFNMNSLFKNQKIKGLSYGLNTNFLLQSSGSAIIWEGLDYAFIPLDSAITKTIGEIFNIDPFIIYVNGNNKHVLRTRYLMVMNDNSTAGNDVGQDNKSSTYYCDYQWQKNFKNQNLRFTIGTSNEITNVASDLFSGKSNRFNNSLYTQFDKNIGKFNISVGARYENFRLKSNKNYLVQQDTVNSFSAGRPIFRTGLNYQLAKATYLRGSWGQGYRFPAMSELFVSTEIAQGIWVYPNASLKPEDGWSSELGIKQGIKIGKWFGYLDFAVFLMQYDDMMEFTFGKWGEDLGETNFYGLGFKSVNVGKTQISGTELSISGQGKINPNLSLSLLAGYTYMNSVCLNPNDPYITTESGGEITYNISSSDPSVLKYRYQHIAKIDAELTYKKVSFASSFRYNDYMKNIDWIFASSLFSSLVPGIPEARQKGENGDIIIDSRFGYQLNNQLRFGIVINNLLNREYMTRPANMMTPRTFALQLSLKI